MLSCTVRGAADVGEPGGLGLVVTSIGSSRGLTILLSRWAMVMLYV